MKKTTHLKSTTSLLALTLAAGLATSAKAGEVLEFISSSGDGYVLADESESVIAPGIQAVTDDPNNDDFGAPNQFSPNGVTNCLMASNPAIDCGAPQGSGKRTKVKLTGSSAFDTVFSAASSGGTTEYFNFGKVSNLTGARMVGFQIVLGTGTGNDFVRADLSSEAGVLTMDDIVTLVTAQALGWEGLIGTEGQDPLQRAFFPGGLFGDGGAEGEAGFFTDPQRAGFFFAPVGTDTLETNGMFGG